MTQPVDQVSVAILPDFKRFAEQLRRGVDEAMREFTRRVDQGLQQVETAVADAGRELGEDFQRGGEQAERAFEELDRSARRHLDSIDRQTTQAADGLRNRMSGAAAIAGAAFLGLSAVAAAGLGAITFMGLKSAAAMEQTQVAFDALLGSAELGGQVFKDLQQFAAQTPFEFAQLTGVAQRFFIFAQQAGFAKTQVTDFLTVMGDVASVTGAGAFGMERVSLAMGQIAAKGRVQQEELLQIAEAFVGFNANAAIAAGLGVTTAEAMKLVSAGSVDADTALRALIEGMRQFPGAAGAMEKQSQTLLGVFSTFKDTINIALVEAFSPVIPTIKQSLTDVTPILGEALQGLAPILGTLLSTLLPLIGILTQALTPVLAPIVEGLAEAVESLTASGALQEVGEALGQILVALQPALPLLGEFLVAALQLSLPVLLLLAQVLRLATPLLTLFADAVHELNRALAMIDWGAVGSAIGSFFTDIGRAIGDFFSDLFGGLDLMPELTSNAFEGLRDTARLHIDAMLGFVRGIPARISAALANAKDLLVERGRELIRGLWAGISGLGGWLYSRVKAFAYDNTVGALKQALGIGSPSRVAAEEVGRWIPPGIGMGAMDAMPALRAMLADATRGTVVGAAPAMAAGAGAGGAVTLGPGAVVVQFSGAVPTPQQALDTGLKVGQGIMDAINRRGMATAVRQRA